MLGSSSVRALCCRGENGFSPDPVSALGLFEVTMCFSSLVQQSPGRLQKECSIRGLQRILSPAQGLEPRSLSRQGCGSRGPARSGRGEMVRGECCVQRPCQPSGDKTPGFKAPWPEGAWMAAGSLCLSPRGCGWAGTRTCSLRSRSAGQLLSGAASLSIGLSLKLGFLTCSPMNPCADALHCCA